jgi:uncharacterized protein YgiB involved in biofilm formation
MKRTKTIDLALMRKQPAIKVAKLSAAIAGVVAMTGCDGSREEGKIYRSLNDCKYNNPGQETICEAAYEEALRESALMAPKYRDEEDCRFEFGDCRSGVDPAGNSWFMPALAGFMVGNLVDFGRPDCPSGYYRSHDRCRSVMPLYTGYGNLYGGYYDADGDRYGDYSSSKRVQKVKVKIKVNKEQRYQTKRDQPKKPAVTRTLSRGGFGSTAAAKSSWGRASGSRSGSWGS